MPLATARSRTLADLHAVGDSLPGLFYVIDGAGRLLAWNQAYERVSGYSAAELEGACVLDFVDPADRERAGVELQRVNSGAYVQAEVTFVSKDGRRTPYLFSGRTVVIDGETFSTGMGIDISDRRQAVDVLRLRELRHARQRDALIDLTRSEALDSDDVAAAFRRITETASRTLGVARASIWSYNADRSAIVCDDLYDRDSDTHASGVELSAAAFPAYFLALDNMSVLAADDARTHPATREFTESYLVPLGIMSMLDAPIRQGGLVDGVICHEHVGEEARAWTSDESAFAVALANLVSLVRAGAERRAAELRLRRSEIRYRALFEQSADAEVLLDEQGFIDCNSAAVTLFGCDSRDELMARHPADLSPQAQPDGSDSRARALAHIAQAVADGQHRFEWLHQRIDGTTFPCDVCLTNVTVDGGQMVLGTIRDLTATREMEAQFRQSQKLEAVATLARGIAHDFNNILGAMLGCAELAKMDAEGMPVVQEMLTQVLAAGQRAAGVVRQLETFSGERPGEPRPLALGPVVAEALALLRSSLPRSIEIGSALDAAAPLVNVDPVHVHQIVMNLGINAAHAIRDAGGAGRITVTVDRTSEAVRLAVHDTGVGMTPDVQARIFEPFFTTKAPGEGTGLGLPTVHGLMAAYGGSIRVSSTPGKGSTFELLFPPVGRPSDVGRPFTGRHD
ncbi:MAG: PAS domain S-box protein [Vicinamibacterales bacterium]